MKTFHEWLTERDQKQCEGLWLGNDKLAQPSMSKVNPFDLTKAKEKSKPTASPVTTFKPKPAVKASALKRMAGVARAMPAC